jgi:hypothetical protein
MSERRNGPPPRDVGSRGCHNPPAPLKEFDDHTTLAHEYIAGLRRRRNASYRLPVLDHGHSDPWQPWRPEVISDVQADAAAAAVKHLDQICTPGLLDIDMRRALWRRGYRDLAVDVHRRSAGVA